MGSGIASCPVVFQTSANQPHQSCCGPPCPVSCQILQPVLVSCDQSAGTWWYWPWQQAGLSNHLENVQMNTWEVPFRTTEHDFTSYSVCQQNQQKLDVSPLQDAWHQLQEQKEDPSQQHHQFEVWQQACPQHFEHPPRQEQEKLVQQHHLSQYEELCDSATSTTDTVSEKSSEPPVCEDSQSSRTITTAESTCEVESDCQEASGTAPETDQRIPPMLPLAWSRDGCRIVQNALESTTGAEQLALAEQLQGHVRSAIKSPYANYVLQKCVEVLPPAHIQFVVDELRGHGAATSRHRFGCRVMQRLVEYCPSEQTAALFDEVLREAPALCWHRFGNFVIQHLLEFGTPHQQRCVVDAVEPQVEELSKHRLASHVVQNALACCLPEEQKRLVHAISSTSARGRALAHSQYGSFVVREMHARCGEMIHPRS